MRYSALAAVALLAACSGSSSSSTKPPDQTPPITVVGTWDVVSIVNQIGKPPPDSGPRVTPQFIAMMVDEAGIEMLGTFSPGGTSPWQLQDPGAILDSVYQGQGKVQSFAQTNSMTRASTAWGWEDATTGFESWLWAIDTSDPKLATGLVCFSGGQQGEWRAVLVLERR